jgi:chromosome segregation ATPase
MSDEFFLPLSVLPLADPNHDPGVAQIIDAETAYISTVSYRKFAIEAVNAINGAAAKNARIAELEAKNADLSKRAVDATFWANQTGDKLSTARAEIEALSKERDQAIAASVQGATYHDLQETIEVLRKRVGKLQGAGVNLIARAEQAEAQLAEAQATSLADRKRAIDVGNGLQTALSEANRQRSEAEAQLAVMREALKPFVANLHVARFMTDGCRYEYRIDAAWLRKARAALQQTLPS